MKVFNNFKEIEQYLKEISKEVLENEVAKKVKDIEQEMVITEVYDAYKPSSPDGEPFRYKRRTWRGGLSDTRNMLHTVTEKGKGKSGKITLEIINDTRSAHEKYRDFEIADLVEYGDGYKGKQYINKTNRDGTAWQYLRARPFTQKTVERLLEKEDHIKAFKNGMNKRGIDVN